MASSRPPTATLRRGLGLAVKICARTLDLIHRPQPGITVLIYHRIGAGTASAVDVPSEMFRRQLAYLARETEVIDIEQAVGLLRVRAPRRQADDPSPDRPETKQQVVITFDDGTRDWIDHALPLLVEYRVPATFYVATAFVEANKPLPNGDPPVSWRGLAEAVSTGLITVGSHTHNHLLLNKANALTAKQEIDSSIALIEDRLAVPCEHFAYPKALAGSPAAEIEVRSRFRSAALGGGRPNPYIGADPYRLTRTPVQDADGIRWFEHKARGGMQLEGRLRDQVSPRRYRYNEY